MAGSCSWSQPTRRLNQKRTSSPSGSIRIRRPHTTTQRCRSPCTANGTKTSDDLERSRSWAGGPDALRIPRIAAAGMRHKQSPVCGGCELCHAGRWRSASSARGCGSLATPTRTEDRPPARARGPRGCGRATAPRGPRPQCPPLRRRPPAPDRGRSERRRRNAACRRTWHGR